MKGPSVAIEEFWSDAVLILTRSHVWAELATAAEEPSRFTVDYEVLSNAVRTFFSAATSRFISNGLQVPLADDA